VSEPSRLLDRVRAARVYAAEQAASWLAPALYAAPVVLSEALPAPAAIDRYGRVYFNPQWLERLQGDVLAQIGFLWVHEVWHWLREHEARAQELRAEPTLWNLAADLEINDYIPKGLQMPDFGAGIRSATPAQYGLPEGHLAEWYYRQLQQQQQQQNQQPQAQGNQQQRNQQPQAQGNQQQQSNQQGQQPGDQAGSEAPDGDVTGSVWDEGSGVHGQPRPWELPPESQETHTLSDFDRQCLKEEVAKRILEEARKTRGTLPAHLVRWAEETLKPRVNWREQLKRVLRGAINDGFGQRLDYSFRRPNRRAAIYEPFILPALQGEYRPRIAVVVDTSGSIGNRELNQAMAEVRAVLEQVRTEITLIPCDARTYDAVKVRTQRDWQVATRHLRGGGGTDMCVGIEEAKRLKPPPDAILVLTDGYTPFPEQPPKPNEPLVIWGLWKLGDEEPPKPPSPPWRQRDIVVIRVEG